MDPNETLQAANKLHLPPSLFSFFPSVNEDFLKICIEALCFTMLLMMVLSMPQPTTTSAARVPTSLLLLPNPKPDTVDQLSNFVVFVHL